MATFRCLSDLFVNLMQRPAHVASTIHNMWGSVFPGMRNTVRSATCSVLYLARAVKVISVTLRECTSTERFRNVFCIEHFRYYLLLQFPQNVKCWIFSPFSLYFSCIYIFPYHCVKSSNSQCHINLISSRLLPLVFKRHQTHKQTPWAPIRGIECNWKWQITFGWYMLL